MIDEPHRFVPSDVYQQNIFDDEVEMVCDRCSYTRREGNHVRDDEVTR